MTEFAKIDCSTVFKDAVKENGNREEVFRFEGGRLKAIDKGETFLQKQNYNTLRSKR